MIIASVVNIVDRTEIFINKLDRLLESTILPDFLYVSIAEYYPRLGKHYGEENIKLIQDKLDSYPINNKLIIYKEDIGPSMKLMTPLNNQQFNDDDYILTFDDDTGLFPSAIECLKRVANIYGPIMVYSIMGVMLDENGNTIEFRHGEYMETGDYFVLDGIGGFRGVLYPYKLINSEDMKKWINVFIDGYKKYNMIAMHDDHIFNGYMRKNNIICCIVNVYPKNYQSDENGRWIKLNYDTNDINNGIFQDINAIPAIEIYDKIYKENFS